MPGRRVVAANDSQRKSRLRVADVASLCHVSPNVIYRAIEQEKIIPLPRPGKIYSFTREEALRYRAVCHPDSAPVGSTTDSAAEGAYLLTGRKFDMLFGASDVATAKDSDFLHEHLLALSRELQGFPPPFRQWGMAFGEIASCLDQIARSDGLESMLRDDTLKLKSIFQHDLRANISSVRDAVPDQDIMSTSAKITEFRDRIEAWRAFVDTWDLFRQAAAACFDRDYQAKKGEYDELRHPTEVWVWDERSQTRVNWNAWNRLISRPAVLDKMADWIAEAVRNLGWEFDAVCQLSSAASSLATLLGIKLDKTVLAADNRTMNFLPTRRAEKFGDSLIVVDMVSQTGKHLSQAIDRAKGENMRVTGAVFVTINDLLENRTELRYKAREMIDKGELIYCYNLSELYELFRGQPAVQH